MYKECRFFLSVIFLACFSLSTADEGGVRLDLPDGVVLRPHLYGHFESGQIMEGSLKKSDVDFLGFKPDQWKIFHIWNQNAVVELGFDAIYNEQMKMAFSLGTKLYFSYPVMESEKYTKNLRQDVYVSDLYAQYHFGDAAMPLFLGQIGYFKFKYNTDCRNFGDYMFRTGTYPIWFRMGFDTPWERLLGMHGQTNLFQSLKLDFLLVSATVHPAMNWSLAGLFDYDIGGLHFAHIGAGFDFANLFSVFSKNFSPGAFGEDAEPVTPKTTNYYYLTKKNDTTFDTNYYTFKGTKIMGRLSLDPKAFLPEDATMFGEDDLKVYIEADIIGLKNYPDTGITIGGNQKKWVPSYDKIWEKMPVAVGFNVPTFKLLDVINLEMEWFGAKYYNDASMLITLGSAPLPNGVDDWGQPDRPKKGFLKWSVYAKKSLAGGHFAIIGQVGRDHTLLPCAAYNREMWNELLVEPSDWGWHLKTSWSF